MNIKESAAKGVAPYLAIGLSTTKRWVSKRSECIHNLKNIEAQIHAAMFIVGMSFPTKVIALTEGAIQGYADEAYDIDHVTYAREIAIEIPGEETDFLGDLAKQYNIYIIAQAKANWPEVIKDRFFNTSFIIDPAGKVIHKCAKNHVFPREHSCTPHDIYDIWVKNFGDGIDAFFPVCHTKDIGNIGTGVCNDGVLAEWGRALALNGAEVLCRPSMAQPITGYGAWLLQNRAHAMFNNCYVLAPQGGPSLSSPGAEDSVDLAGGNSHIVDYQGRIISFNPSGKDSVVAAVIDIEALRHFREMALWGNWMKDLRTEIFMRMYEKPIHPKNLFIDRGPLHHAEHDKIYRANILKLQERGVYTPPAQSFCVGGTDYIHPIQDPSKRAWGEIKKKWG